MNLMNENKSTYQGGDRRLPENARLRLQLDQISQDFPECTSNRKEEIFHLFDLVREFCRCEGGRGSMKLFRMIREQREAELSPAMLALLDDILEKSAQ